MLNVIPYKNVIIPLKNVPNCRKKYVCPKDTTNVVNGTKMVKTIKIFPTSEPTGICSRSKICIYSNNSYFMVVSRFVCFGFVFFYKFRQRHCMINSIPSESKQTVLMKLL